MILTNRAIKNLFFSGKKQNRKKKRKKTEKKQNSYMIVNPSNWHDDQFKVESCIRSFIKHNLLFLYKMYMTNLLYWEKTHARNDLSLLSLIYHIENLWLLPNPLYVHTCKDTLYWENNILSYLFTYYNFFSTTCVHVKLYYIEK